MKRIKAKTPSTGYARYAKSLALLFAIMLAFAGFASLAGCNDSEGAGANKASAAPVEEATENTEGTAADAFVATPPEDPGLEGEASAADETEESVEAKDPEPAKTGKVKKDTSKNASSSKSKTASNDKSKTSAPKSDKDSKAKPADDKITVTLSVDCKLLYDEEPELAELVSDKGVMVDGKSVTVKNGATILDVLKASGIDYVGSKYISGIGGLSEKDAGLKSGWCYSVNGVFPTLGVTKFTVKDGDEIAFRYALDAESFGV